MDLKSVAREKKGSRRFNKTWVKFALTGGALLIALAASLTASALSDADVNVSVIETPVQVVSAELLQVTADISSTIDLGREIRAMTSEQNSIRAMNAQEAVIQDKIAEIAEKYGAVGVSVTTIENGSVGTSYAWGWAVLNQKEMTVDTKVRVASVSKIVVAMAALSMQDEGIVDLDASIGTYWGKTIANPYYSAPVSIAAILSHTSSLYDLDYAASAGGTLSQLTRKGNYRDVEPGNASGWYYNNYAFGVLGSTLEVASGQKLENYLNEKMFSKLGIDASFYSGNVNSALLASLYDEAHSVTRSASYLASLSSDGVLGTDAWRFAGGLTISSCDLAKLVAVLANDGNSPEGEILSEEAVSQMETPLFTATEDGGVFWQCLPLRYCENIYGRDALYFHCGAAYGVYSLISYDPETGDGVIVITTGSNSGHDAFGNRAICGEISELLYSYL